MSGSAVLVHGGWSNPEDWRWVRANLDAAGVEVLAPDLPSHRSPAATRHDDVSEVRGAIAAARGPVVVVGWSYGGFVLTDLSETVGSITRLVYVTAIPRPLGTTPIDPIPGVVEAGELDTSHLRFDEDGTCVLDDEWWLSEGEVSTCSNEALDHLRTHRRRPMSLAALLAPQTATAWKEVPSTVLLGLRDSTQSPSEREWAQSHCEDVRLLDSDHFMLFRRPEVIADVVLEALHG